MKVATQNKLRVVFDTNIYLSALMFGGKPKKAVELGERGKFTIIISKPILIEIGERLSNKFIWPKNKIEATVSAILNFSQLVGVKGSLAKISADPKDNSILETAIKGKVNYLITGDRHLLKLKEYQDIKIIKVADFLKKLS